MKLGRLATLRGQTPETRAFAFNAGVVFIFEVLSMQPQNNRARHLLAAALVVLAVAAPIAQAEAKIVVGRGAAGVKLGDSKHNVLRKLGKPFRTEPTFLVFPKPCLCTVNFKHHRAASIDVLSKSQRTRKGVGVGTSYERTTAAYPEARCYHPRIYGETSRLCVLKSRFKDRSVKTIFAFFEQDLGVRDVEIRFG